MRRLVLVVAVLAVSAGVGVARQQGKVRLEGDAARRKALAAIEGKPAPELQPQRWLNGKPVKLADLKGKVVLLDFWGKW
jgi:cytochrome oxidase Cu insertion factor (SCO1/SenC/PrrC family)